MANKFISPVAGGLRGLVAVPGDKSVSHRAVMLSALGSTPVTVKNFLPGADCLSTVACMRAMGADIRQNGDELTVTGQGLNGLAEPSEILDAGNSGTTLRLLMGLVAPRGFFAAFCGDESLTRRPMARVIKPLAAMGAKINGRAANKFLPLAVLPAEKKLRGITYDSPVASAQVKSAILLAGLLAEGKTVVNEPYLSRNHTEKMLAAFGVNVATSGSVTTLAPPRTEEFRAPQTIEIPGDISSAAYWIVAASIIPDSKIKLLNVGINETRAGILDVLQKMGAKISVANKRVSGGEPMADLTVESADLISTDFGAETVPRLIDEIPVIAGAALFAEGTTVMRDVGELRVKETDRLRGIADEFGKIAPGSVKIDGDNLIIHGKKQLQKANVRAYGDHRMAMTLAVVASAGCGANFADDPSCVDISYPTFFETLEDLRNG